MTQRCHHIWRADGNPPHDRQTKPLWHLAWRPKRAVEHPSPPFLYPLRYFAFRIAPLFWPVIKSQAVLADLNKAKASIVTRIQAVAFGGDAIAMEMSLATIGIVIELFDDVQNGAR